MTEKKKFTESKIFLRVKDQVVFAPINDKIDMCEELQLTKIVAEAPDEESKKILLKIDLNDTFENNFKKVNSYKMVALKKLLIYLMNVDINKVKAPLSISRLKAEGVALEIIKKVNALMNHTCLVCCNVVEKSIEEGTPKISCVGCGTKACYKC